MNIVILFGNVVADPQLTQTQNQSTLSRVRIAVRKPFANASGEYESDFISVLTFGKTADYTSRYVKKGDTVSIRGRLDVIKKKDSDYTELAISCEQIEIVKKGQSTQQASNEQVEQPKQEKSIKQQIRDNDYDIDLNPIPDDDLPF